MKLGRYLFAALILMTARTSESRAQNQPAPDQSENPPNFVRLNPAVPAQAQSGQQSLVLDYGDPNVDYTWSQYQPQVLQDYTGLNWESAVTDGKGSWWAFEPGRDMELVPVDDALRDHLKLSKGQGLVVTAVDGNSPAARAGIQQNDVLLTLGDAPLGKPEDLEANLKKAGEKPLALGLIRNGRRLVVQVQPRFRVTLAPAQTKDAEQSYWIGVEVAAIGPALRAQLQVPANTGVLVNQVIAGSPAEKAGVKVHDILLELDGKPLSDPYKLASLVQAHGSKPIVATLRRAGGTNNETVEITPEQRKSTAGPTPDIRGRNFYFVRPGAMMPDSSGNFYRWTRQAPTQPNQMGRKPAEDPGAAVSKRLDALDAEIKQLRKAVEGLKKTESIIEELNKVVESLNKAAKENK
jgi:membrane-associated protease RseP (regulator of RpoE activity)